LCLSSPGSRSPTGCHRLYCDTAAVDCTSALRHSPLLCTPGEPRERAVRGMARRHAIQTPYLCRSFSKQKYLPTQAVDACDGEGISVGATQEGEYRWQGPPAGSRTAGDWCLPRLACPVTLAQTSNRGPAGIGRDHLPMRSVRGSSLFESVHRCQLPPSHPAC
jgi:hypothetical protein